MKILLATHDQVHQVITKEKESLYAHLLTAEDYEICFIEMAKTMLQVNFLNWISFSLQGVSLLFNGFQFFLWVVSQKSFPFLG